MNVQAVADELCESVEERREFDARGTRLFHYAETAFEVVFRYRGEERREKFVGRNSENGAHRVGLHVAAGEGVRLVEERERVAHGTVGFFREDSERFRIG